MGGRREGIRDDDDRRRNSSARPRATSAGGYSPVGSVTYHSMPVNLRLPAVQQQAL